MKPKYLHRFDGRADSYSKYRPRYPPEVIRAIEDSAGFDKSWVVADVGSGTGILSELFLKNGNRVYCVEPNEAMRKVAEKELKGYPNLFISVDGSAEETTLPPGSVDLVVAGQALHWFDAPKARREFRRILGKGGTVAIVYNYRKRGQGMQAAYEDLVARNSIGHAPDTADVDEPYVRKFMRSRVEKFVVHNSQTLGFDGLLGRLASASYMPPKGSPLWKGIGEDVRRVIKKYGRGGKVTLEYETTLYLGKLG